MEKIFEQATRNKYRFPYKGLISVEDIWDLNVQSLDSVFKALNSQAKQAKEESLLNTRSVEDTELEVKIGIVKYIVGVKLDEEDKRKKAKDLREQKQKIMSILSSKQEEELHGKSVDELKAMLTSLE